MRIQILENLIKPITQLLLTSILWKCFILNLMYICLYMDTFYIWGYVFECIYIRTWTKLYTMIAVGL
jgi:hypothetical protein